MLRRNTFLFSLVLHTAVLASLLLAAERRQAHRRATAIQMAEEKKKEKPKEKPRPPAPPKVERPKPSSPRQVAEQKPVAPSAPPPSHEPPPSSPLVDSGLTMGNDDGPGIAGDARGVGPASQGGPRAAPALGPKRAGPAPRKPDKKDKQDAEDECQEEASKPEPIASPQPEYTQEARAAGIEGLMKLRLLIEKDGSVAKVQVLKSVDPQLDAAVIAFLKERWRFRPATRCGRPISGGVFVVAPRFELGD